MRQDSLEKARNTHIWAEEHPRAIREHSFHNNFLSMFGAGVIQGQLLGPHILPPRQYLVFA
jgi:hypothetical protein